MLVAYLFEQLYINSFPRNVYICYRIVKILILWKKGEGEKFPMCVAPMSC